ncbi:MAG: DUF1570 domain-containing protein, partial [Planctomycetota bacterium]
MYKTVNKNILLLLFAVLAALNTAWADDLTIPHHPHREKALLKAAGSDMTIKRTTHFLIAHDVDDSLIIELISRLEHTYHAVYRFCKACGIQTRRPKHRLEVIVFNDQIDYRRYSYGLDFPAEGTYGMYYEPTNRSAFFNVNNGTQMKMLHAGIITGQERIEKLMESVKNIKNNKAPVEIIFNNGRRIGMSKKQAKKEIAAAQRTLKHLEKKYKAYAEHINQTVIQHETAHQVLFNAGIHVRGAANPIWVVEGLACLFETPPGNTGAGFATINHQRLKDFRSAIAGLTEKKTIKSEDLVEAVKTGRITPLTELIRNPHIFHQPGRNSAVQYATAWALIHYLHRVK